jgi:hypothetical protein
MSLRLQKPYHEVISSIVSSGVMLLLKFVLFSLMDFVTAGSHTYPLDCGICFHFAESSIRVIE